MVAENRKDETENSKKIPRREQRAVKHIKLLRRENNKMWWWW
jgi:hypothetical protein